VTRDDVRKAVIDVLSEIQTLSGRQVPMFSDELCPADDIAGFDSLNAEEATVALVEKLGFELKDNPFASDDRNLRVGEIVDRICASALAQKGK